MDLKLTNTFERLREHYELTDQDVDQLRSLPLKEMFTITEALKESNYERLDELISTVRALGQGTANKMKPTIGKMGKGAGMAGDAIKTTGAYRGAANTANKVGQVGSYVGTQTAKGYDDYQQAKNAVKNKISGKTAAATGAVKKVGGALSNIASQIKGNVQRGMGAGQNNDAMGAIQGTQRVAGPGSLADTDMDDLGYELDQVDQDSLAQNMAPTQDPKTGQVTRNVNIKKNDSLRVVGMDDKDPTKPITLATRDNKKIKIDPKTGAKVESKETKMKAKELTEAVGEFAEPIYQLCDELDCPDHSVFDELVRYMSGDQIKDFVADYRRHHDMNDMEEGFKSDAQRKAAFANGYDPKKKKKESVNEDETDDEKASTIYTLRMSLENLKDEIDQLADLDAKMDSSGRGDLQDQLTTMDKLVSNFEAVLDRAKNVVPSDLEPEALTMGEEAVDEGKMSDIHQDAQENDRDDFIKMHSGTLGGADKAGQAWDEVQAQMNEVYNVNMETNELDEIRRLAGMKETTSSGSIAGTTDGFGTIAQHRSLIRRFQKQNKKK